MGEKAVNEAAALKLAAVQMVSTSEPEENLEQAGRLIERAAGRGATLVVLPEYFPLMGGPEQRRLELREQPGKGPLQEFLAAAARRHGIWLVGGTIPLAGASAARARSACLLFNPEGAQVARYDKLHLFDVEIAGDALGSYRESDTVEPGDEVVTADTALGRIGLSVCYDLRFPELYRTQAASGARVLVVPSAFTAATGACHWELLLRSRAVENLCFVVAANQGGDHGGGRLTYGHSMIVDPWGNVLEALGEGSGVALAEMHGVEQDRLRRSFPVLLHRRLAGPAPPSAANGGGA